MAAIYTPSSFGDQGFFPGSSGVDPYGNTLAVDRFGRSLTPASPSFAAPGSAFGSFGGSALTPPINPPGQPGSLTTPALTNPFTTITNVKNPNLQAGIDSVLAKAKQLSWDPNTNSYVLRNNVKSAPIQSQINSATNQFGLDVNNSRQSLADFTNQFLAGSAEARKNQQQESGAINRIYDPNGLQADLANNASQRAIALRQNLQRALGQAGRGANASRLTSGDSSYIDQQHADTIAGQITAENLANSGLQRQNLTDLATARTGNAGLRNRLLDEMLSRGLVPLQASQGLYGNELSRLNSLSGASNSNNQYTMDSQDQQLARQLEVLRQVGSLDQANNFYGVQKPFNYDTTGLNAPLNYNLPMPRYPQANRPSPSGGYPNPFPYQPGVVPQGNDPYNGFGGGNLDPNAQRIQQQIKQNSLNQNWWDQWGGNPGAPASGGGYIRQPDGSYDIQGNVNYADPSSPLYYPGWAPQTGPNPYE